MDEEAKPGALARWWKATWTNLVALTFCIVWLVIVQVVGLFRFMGWIFTLPVNVLAGARREQLAEMPTPPPDAPRPERRRSDRAKTGAPGAWWR